MKLKFICNGVVKLPNHSLVQLNAAPVNDLDNREVSTIPQAEIGMTIKNDHPALALFEHGGEYIIDISKKA